MANKTDQHALHKFGIDPQHLIPPTTRNAVYESMFWNRSCFGVTVADVVHLTVGLRYVGGSDSVSRRPSSFLCLLLKLLQLSPDFDEISVFLKQPHFKYHRILAAFYVRLVETPVNIYRSLEPLLSDCRRVVVAHDPAIEVPSALSALSNKSFDVVYVDIVVDALLRSSELFGISLPRIPPRPLLVETDQLKARESALHV